MAELKTTPEKRADVADWEGLVHPTPSQNLALMKFAFKARALLASQEVKDG